MATSASSELREHSSYANFHEVRVVHSDYDLTVDLEKKCIEGYVQLHVKASKPTSSLVLDTRDLDIVTVQQLDATDGKEPKVLQDLSTDLSDSKSALGQKLTIDFPSPVEDRACVGIHFRVGDTSSAVQFLDPSQTAGKKHPYLFTQCQAIHARSLVPCQDTPNVKMTYSARVSVAKPLTALMSAKTVDGVTPQPSRFAASLGDLDAVATYQFEQSLPIPSYLVALAVGELESRRLGPISRVWAEPSVVESAAYEFAETQKYLEAAEELAGEYRWGQYDLLLLPPSFPYGGMENACLTFVTPTLLTGDRSATNVVAHEIAHSWTGNLVTNATWESFWLNEGWTVFLERKILGRVFGFETEQFHAVNGFAALRNTVADFGDTHPFTALCPDLSGGADPDDAFSRIPYEKGFYFLYYLQTLVGGPSVFEPFMKAYIDHFKFTTCTALEFKDFVLDYFQDTPAIKDVDWDTWYYKPGMPPVTNEYDTTLVEAAEKLALRWHTADVLRLGTSTPDPVSASDIEGWSADQLCAFLTKLGQFAAPSPLHPNTTRKLNEAYGLDAMRHPEVRCKWLQLCINAEDKACLDDALSFAKEQGRMKFVRPLYKALGRSEFGSSAAKKQFKAIRKTYHPIAEKMVASDLQLS